MIDPKELRLGNYLIELHSGITTIDHNDLSLIALGSKDFQPIQITKEWLLDFGAVLHPWGWVLEHFLISWDHKKDFWIEVGNGSRIYFKHVHVLQNFFQLVGKELTISNP